MMTAQERLLNAAYGLAMIQHQQIKELEKSENDLCDIIGQQENELTHMNTLCKKIIRFSKQIA